MTPDPILGRLSPGHLATLCFYYAAVIFIIIFAQYEFMVAIKRLPEVSHGHMLFTAGWVGLFTGLMSGPYLAFLTRSRGRDPYRYSRVLVRPIGMLSNERISALNSYVIEKGFQEASSKELSSEKPTAAQLKTWVREQDGSREPTWIALYINGGKQCLILWDGNNPFWIHNSGIKNELNELGQHLISSCNR